MAHLKNTGNEYAIALGALFDEMPKSVIAAIAVSAMTCGGDHLSDAIALVAGEWRTLHENGIVPQKPGKNAQHALSRVRKAWRVRSPWQESWQGEIIFASTASKARYQGYLAASEHDDDLKITDLSVKRSSSDDVKLPHRHELANSLSQKALDCLLHATGVNKPLRAPTGKRNFFYTSENDPQMIELMQHELMENTKRGWEEGSVYFQATTLGLAVARSCEPLYEHEVAA